MIPHLYMPCRENCCRNHRLNNCKYDQTFATINFFIYPRLPVAISTFHIYGIIDFSSVDSKLRCSHQSDCVSVYSVY